MILRHGSVYLKVSCRAAKFALSTFTAATLCPPERMRDGLKRLFLYFEALLFKKRKNHSGQLNLICMKEEQREKILQEGDFYLSI